MLEYFIDRFIIKRPALRRALTTLFWGDRSGYISLAGSMIYGNTIRENGYYRAERNARKSSFWRDEVAVLMNLAMLMEEGDTFVDIGANVGIYSVVLARFAKLHSAMRFYAFEPNPDTYSRLVKSLQDTPVEAHNIALSDHRGTLFFVDGAVSHVFTTVENASAYNIRANPISVPCVRLDEMEIAGNSIVLKIDVEGQEDQVLRGAQGLLEAGRIKAVYIDGFKNKVVLQTLRANGFHLLDGRTLAPAGDDVFSLLARKPPV